MTVLTVTQTRILTTGARRADYIALPLPKGLHGAATKVAATRMIINGWQQEVHTNLRRNEPLWRETGYGHHTTLEVTDAGLLAIGIEPVVVRTVAAIRKQTAELPMPKMPAIRAGIKQAMLIEMLQRSEGSTVAEMVAAMGWMGHTMRGAISGVLKKKLGFSITSEKVEGRGLV